MRGCETQVRQEIEFERFAENYTFEGGRGDPQDLDKASPPAGQGEHGTGWMPTAKELGEIQGGRL